MSDTNQTRGLQLRSLVTTEQTVEVSLTEVEVPRRDLTRSWSEWRRRRSTRPISAVSSRAPT